MCRARFFAVLGIIFSAGAMRLLPHPPNMTPITAIALFGGVYFTNRRTAFLVPLVVMYLSDLVLGFFVYNFGWFNLLMPFVYASFAVTVCFGLLIRRRLNLLMVSGAALTSSVLFFIVTNFGVWLIGDLYPKSVAGLLGCYVAAIPFFRNALAGDMVYTLVLFGGFSFAQRYLPVLREKPVGIPVHVYPK